MHKTKPKQLRETEGDLIINKILDWLFPARCPLCDEPVGMGRRGFCRECGEKLQPIRKELHGECPGKEHFFIEGRALYEYAAVAPAIYRFKYAGRREYAAAFAEEMCRELGGIVKGWRPDGMVPVPLHPKRLRKRGYNQAGLLAEELGRRLNIPVYQKLLKRCRNTVPQKNLNAAERQNNLKKAFKMCRNDVKLNTIVIVDDIYTTGQTVDEIARVLTAGGVKKIYVLTLAGGAG